MMTFDQGGPGQGMMTFDHTGQAMMTFDHGGQGMVTFDHGQAMMSHGQTMMGYAPQNYYQANAQLENSYYQTVPITVENTAFQQVLATDVEYVNVQGITSQLMRAAIARPLEDVHTLIIYGALLRCRELEHPT